MIRILLIIFALVLIVRFVVPMLADHGQRVIERNAEEYRQGCAAQGFTIDQCDWLNRNFRPLGR